MKSSHHHRLSRRERQIMDVIYQAGEATAADVHRALPDPPAETSVRKLVRVLEEKGHLSHERRGRHYVYRPTVPRDQARNEAVTHLLDTFFEGSAPGAVAALLDVSRDRLSPEDAARLADLIEKAAREGR